MKCIVFHKLTNPYKLKIPIKIKNSGKRKVRNNGYGGSYKKKIIK